MAMAANPSRASQASLPAAIGTFNHDISENVFTFPVSRSFGCGSAAISAASRPGVFATDTNCAHAVQTILTYYIEFDGPFNPALPVFITSTTELEADGQAVAGASGSINGQIIIGDNCYVSIQSGCGKQSHFVERPFAANQLYSVTLNVIAHNSFGAGMGYAFLDPVFSFNPSFANAADYMIRLSPGIGNGVPVIAVPEPEILSMMLVGIAGLALRRRTVKGGL